MRTRFQFLISIFYFIYSLNLYFLAQLFKFNSWYYNEFSDVINYSSVIWVVQLPWRSRNCLCVLPQTCIICLFSFFNCNRRSSYKYLLSKCHFEFLDFLQIDPLLLNLTFHTCHLFWGVKMHLNDNGRLNLSLRSIDTRTKK